MGKIYINTDAVYNLKSNIYKKRNSCRDYSGRVYSVQNNLYWKVLNQQRIRTRLNNLRSRINRQSELLYSYSQVLGTVNNNMTDTDNKLRCDARKIACQMSRISKVMKVCQNGTKRSKKIWGLDAKNYSFITSLFGNGINGASLSTKILLDNAREWIWSDGGYKTAQRLGYANWASDIRASAWMYVLFKTIPMSSMGTVVWSGVAISKIVGLVDGTDGTYSGGHGGSTKASGSGSKSPFDIPGISGKGAGVAGDWLGYEVNDDGIGVTGWLGRGSARAEGDYAYAGVNAYLGKAQAEWDADFSLMETKKEKEYNKETGKWEESDQLTFVNAEIGAGASVAAVSVDAEAGVGVDALGVEVEGEGSLGKATAEAKGKLNISEDGVNAYVKGELKATGAEGELKGTLNLGLIEVTGKVEGYAGSVGVEGEFGIRDNKFVVSGGAAAILGAGAGIEVGINNEFIDEVKDCICDAADEVGNTIDGFMQWIGW